MHHPVEDRVYQGRFVEIGVHLFDQQLARGQGRVRADAVVEAFVDASLPAGVLGLDYGPWADISSYLVAHTAIRKIAFTESTPVG